MIREQVAAWAADPPDKEGWADRLSSGGVFVADFDGRLGGFVRVEEGGLIDLLYVDPLYEGLGVGRAGGQG